MRRCIVVLIALMVIMQNFLPVESFAKDITQVVVDRTQTNIVVCGKSETEISVPVTFMMTEKGKNFFDSKTRYVYQALTDEDGKYMFKFPRGDINFSDIDVRITVDGRDISDFVTAICEVTNTYTINIEGSMDTKLMLNINVLNPINSDKSFSLLYGFYDKSGHMLGSEMSRILPSGKSTNKSVMADVPVGAAYAKIFCWNDLSELLPLKSAVTVLKGTDYNEETVQINLPENKAPITKNPGKGWVRYGTVNTENEPETSQKALDYSSVAYCRWDWYQIEPNEGEYNWNVIDNAIGYWDNKGIKFAFGIMNSDSGNTNKFITPKWVFDAGAKYSDTKVNPFSGSSFIQAVPDWDDAVFKSKLRNFVNALAQRYDGDSRVAWVDIRSFGNYGEWHLTRLEGAQMPSTECQMELAQIYVDAFEGTDLAICQNAVNYLGRQYLLDNGIYIRDDGAFGLSGTKTDSVDGIITISEMIQPYGTYKSNYGWNNGTYFKYFSKMKQNYMDIGEWGTDTELFIRDNEEIIRYLTNKMGYNFFLSNVTMPQQAQINENISLNFKWINNGISYLDGNANIAVALLDENDNVVKKLWSDYSLDTLKSGEIFDDTVNISLEDNPIGFYKLAVGVFEDRSADKPQYKIANFGANDDGWYCIAEVTKDDNGYKFSNYLDEINVNGINIGARVIDYTNDSYILYSDVEIYLSDGTTDRLNDVMVEFDGKKYLSLNSLADSTVLSYELRNGKVYISDETELQNQIQNGSFENGTDFWNVNDAFVISSEQSANGQSSLAVNNSISGSKAVQRVRVDYENIFTLSFKTKGNASIKAYALNSIGEKVGNVDVVCTDEGWNDYSIRFNLFDVGNYYLGDHLLKPWVDVVFETTGSGGLTYIDSIYLEQNDCIGNYKNDGILIDYDAEVNFDSWVSRSGSGTVERSTDNPQQGNYCFKTVLGARFSGAQIDIADALKDSGAGTYCFEGYFRTGSDDTIEQILIRPLRITCKDNSQIDLGGMTVENVTGDWKYVRKEFTISESDFAKMSDATSIIGTGTNNDTGKELCFDGIKIRKIR